MNEKTKKQNKKEPTCTISRPNTEKKTKNVTPYALYQICPGGSVSFDRAVKSQSCDRENCHLGLPNETSPVLMMASRRIYPSRMGEG